VLALNIPGQVQFSLFDIGFAQLNQYLLWIHNLLGLYPQYNASEFSRRPVGIFLNFGCRPRTDEFVVKAYHGGPNGVDNPGAIRFWHRYQDCGQTSSRPVQTQQLQWAAPLPLNSLSNAATICPYIVLLCHTVNLI
jgi:hypothetical protein